MNIKGQSTKVQLEHQQDTEVRTQKKAHFIDCKWANPSILRHKMQIHKALARKWNQRQYILGNIKIQSTKVMIGQQYDMEKRTN